MKSENVYGNELEYVSEYLNRDSSKDSVEGLKSIVDMPTLKSTLCEVKLSKIREYERRFGGENGNTVKVG